MTTDQPSKPKFARTILLSSFLLLAFVCFVALGIWQIQRLGWKEALIARVDSRVHAAATPAPAKAEWPKINAQDDEYKHVQVTGLYDNSKETYVYASTELGPGYWVITPLKTLDGQVVLINRGFVPLDRKEPSTRPQSQLADTVTVTGLLRLSEPQGTLLRNNDPQSDRWYSRDVAAIAAKRDLTDVAPYFIDADKTDIAGTYPVGGLTQVKFPNSHLQYAITWFAMAVMTLAFLWFLLRSKHNS